MQPEPTAHGQDSSWRHILEAIASGQYANGNAGGSLPLDEDVLATERNAQRHAAGPHATGQPFPAGVTQEQAGSPISTAILRHLARRSMAAQPPSGSSTAPSTAPPSPEVDESAAAAAERHRLSSSSVVDLQVRRRRWRCPPAGLIAPLLD
jgi:hypothetical protein